MTASGAVLVLFALVILLLSASGILANAWLIGLFALVYGALTIARVFRSEHRVA